MGCWLCHHELRPVDVVRAFLAARCSRVEVVSCTCPRCHKLLVSPVDRAASPTTKRSCDTACTRGPRTLMPSATHSPSLPLSSGGANWSWQTKTSSRSLTRTWGTRHHAGGMIGSEFGTTSRIALAIPLHCVAAVTLAEEPSAVEMREWLAD